MGQKRKRKRWLVLWHLCDCDTEVLRVDGKHFRGAERKALKKMTGIARREWESDHSEPFDPASDWGYFDLMVDLETGRAWLNGNPDDEV